MSIDTVNRESKAKQDIGWDGLIRDAEEQIENARQRIEKLRDSIAFFKKQRRLERAATQN